MYDMICGMVCDMVWYGMICDIVLYTFQCIFYNYPTRFLHVHGSNATKEERQGPFT